MKIGTERDITRTEILDEIKSIRVGCGVRIGVPIFMKFKPCGETYKGKHYFCDACESKLGMWLVYRWFFDKGFASAKKSVTEEKE